MNLQNVDLDKLTPEFITVIVVIVTIILAYKAFKELRK